MPGAIVASSESGMTAPISTPGPDLERTLVDDTRDSALASTGTEPGSLLAGKYRLELLLGEGGMGSVWSAYNVELELPVALKLLKAGAPGDKLQERLRLEARAVARLIHPSIVRVLDVAATEQGAPFIVMELLQGETLTQTLSRGCLKPTKAVQLLLPIAEGLALAHAKGIVHRDVKPDNIFLAREEGQLQPKLLDFGIAKLEHAVLTHQLTERGITLGSPIYMSPEQARGDVVDPRSDVWSLCVVLYKAIAGRAPFKGKSQRRILDAILHEEPLPFPEEFSVDPKLAELICWGLSKDPEHRPGTVRELGRRLALWLIEQGEQEDATGAPLAARWLDPQPSDRTPPRSTEVTTERIVRRPRQPWVLMATIPIAIASAGLAWSGILRDPPQPTSVPTRTVAAPPPVMAAPRILAASVAETRTFEAEPPPPASASERPRPPPARQKDPPQLPF
jgi:eukaryotic-like serine/threonine-protein kinase